MYVVVLYHVCQTSKACVDDSCCSKKCDQTACFAAPLSVTRVCCRVVQGRGAGWIRSSVISYSLVACFLFVVVPGPVPCIGSCFRPHTRGPIEKVANNCSFRCNVSGYLEQHPSQCHITMHNSLASKHSSLPPLDNDLRTQQLRTRRPCESVQTLSIRTRTCREGPKSVSTHTPHYSSPGPIPTLVGKCKAT